MVIPRGNGTLKQLTRGQTNKGADRYAEPNSDDDEVNNKAKGSSGFWAGSIDISKGSVEQKGRGTEGGPTIDKAY